ncbi:MAG: hypothetical protein U0694_14715 [Anaerolineae bacterium]
MSEQTPELEQVVSLALSLSPLDKVRLVEQVMATLEQDLKSANPKPRRSLLGILSPYGAAPSTEDMDEARREMWGTT